MHAMAFMLDLLPSSQARPSEGYHDRIRATSPTPAHPASYKQLCIPARSYFPFPFHSAPCQAREDTARHTVAAGPVEPAK